MTWQWLVLIILVWYFVIFATGGRGRTRVFRRGGLQLTAFCSREDAQKLLQEGWREL